MIRRNNAQEVFDTSVSHLIKQGKPAATDGMYGTCSYRTPEGLKCAVGCLITTKEYKKSMEGKNVSALIEDNLIPKKLLPYIALLKSLQKLHDITLFSSGIGSKFINEAVTIASDFGLAFKFSFPNK